MDFEHIGQMSDEQIVNFLYDRDLLDRTEQNSKIINMLEDEVMHRGIEHKLKCKTPHMPFLMTGKRPY